MIIAEGAMVCNNQVYIIHPYASVKYGETLCRDDLKKFKVDHFTLVWDDDGDVFTPLSFTKTIIKGEDFKNAEIVKRYLMKFENIDYRIINVLDRIGALSNNYLKDVRYLIKNKANKEDYILAKRMLQKCMLLDDQLVHFTFLLAMWLKTEKAYEDFSDRALAGTRYLWCHPGKFEVIFNKDFSITRDECISESFIKDRKYIWNKIYNYILNQ